MGKEPVCPLCSDRLERQKDVTIQAGGSSVLSYTIAWVCTNCSAVFPAVGRRARPLYEDRGPIE